MKNKLRFVASLSAMAIFAASGMAITPGVDHEVPATTHSQASLNKLLEAAPGVRFLDI